MAQAVRLAALGRCRTHPNPMVGCVLVRDGQVVGTGYHRWAGEPHAEAYALGEAGDLAGGATAYVTLEPCAHFGRTPPCADALVRAGVARVVAAMVDPDSRVAGRGLERLRTAGVAVETGCGEAEAVALNRAYLKLRKTGRPLVILKWAMTLDGKIAAATGDSKWVTGEAARAQVHQIRDQVDAILVGRGTVEADDPELTCRATAPGPLPGWAGGLDPGPDPSWAPRHPLRIVLSRSGRLPSAARIRHVTVAADPVALLDDLGRQGIASLLVEGGAQTHWSFLSQGLADYLMVYVAPKIIGGATAKGPVGGEGFARMAQALRLSGLKATWLGEDLLLEGEVPPCSPA